MDDDSSDIEVLSQNGPSKPVVPVWKKDDNPPAARTVQGATSGERRNAAPPALDPTLKLPEELAGHCFSIVDDVQSQVFEETFENLTFDPAAVLRIAGIAEAVLCHSWASKLGDFAAHAKRQTITDEDVHLLFHPNARLTSKLLGRSHVVSPGPSDTAAAKPVKSGRGKSKKSLVEDAEASRAGADAAQPYYAGLAGPSSVAENPVIPTNAASTSLARTPLPDRSGPGATGPAGPAVVPQRSTSFGKKDSFDDDNDEFFAAVKSMSSASPRVLATPLQCCSIYDDPEPAGTPAKKAKTLFEEDDDVIFDG